MSEALSGSAAPRITCSGCGKSYAWKPELAGKRVKCKCGTVMSVPDAMDAAPPPPPQEEDLYDFAPSSEPVKPAKAPRVPLAPLAPRGGGGTSAGMSVATAGVGTIPRPGGAPAGLG